LALVFEPLLARTGSEMESEIPFALDINRVSEFPIFKSKLKANWLRDAVLLPGTFSLKRIDLA